MKPLIENAARIVSLTLVALSINTGFAKPGEIEIGGELEVGFGMVEIENEGTKEWDGIGEATLNFAGTKDQFSAQVEIVVAEDAKALDSAEHELVWAPTGYFAVTISGSSFGIGATDGNISVVNAPGGRVGDEEAIVDFAETGMLNLEFTIGDLVLGVALLDACVPDCGFGLDAPDTKPIRPDAELLTVVMHGRGSAAGLSYDAYVAASRGTISESAQEGVGNAAGFGLKYEGDGFWAGFDLSRAVSQCSAAAGATACGDDNEQTKYGAALGVAGFGIHYFFGSNETGAAREETTNIDVVYLIEVGAATVGPEFRTTTVESAGSPKFTDTFALFGMSLEF